MELERLGSIYNALVDRKFLFTKSMPWRRQTLEQTAVADYLRSHPDDLDDLELFLKTQGLMLVVKSFEEIGLANPDGNAFAYFLVRDMDTDLAPHIRPAEAVTSLSGARSNDTNEQKAVWSTFLTLALLHNIYTIDQRAIRFVTGWRNTYLKDVDFLDYVERELEAIRTREASDHDYSKLVFDALTQEKNPRVRAKKFLQTCLRQGILMKHIEYSTSEAGVIVFQQTPWSAVDLAENFNLYAGHLIPSDEIEHGISSEDVIGVGLGQIAPGLSEDGQPLAFPLEAGPQSVTDPPRESAIEVSDPNGEELNGSGPSALLDVPNQRGEDL